VTGLINHGRGGIAAFLALIAINIVSGALLIWLAANRASVAVVVPFAFGAWGSYLGAHYLVEGELVDNSAPDRGLGENQEQAPEQDRKQAHGQEPPAADSEGSVLPETAGRRLFAAVGIGSMVVAFPTGIFAVGGGEFPLMLLSASLFTGGYVVGHHGLTGKPL